jgi:hypothetical protein
MPDRTTSLRPRQRRRRPPTTRTQPFPTRTIARHIPQPVSAQGATPATLAGIPQYAGAEKLRWSGVRSALRGSAPRRLRPDGLQTDLRGLRRAPVEAGEILALTGAAPWRSGPWVAAGPLLSHKNRHKNRPPLSSSNCTVRRTRVRSAKTQALWLLGPRGPVDRDHAHEGERHSNFRLDVAQAVRNP